MAAPTKKQDSPTPELYKHIGELIIKEFTDFKRYLGHDIQLEHLYEVRTREYWAKVESKLMEELKSNGRNTGTGTATDNTGKFDFE